MSSKSNLDVSRKLQKAKTSLDFMILQILEINRRKKTLAQLKQSTSYQRKELKEELKVLNKIASQQASLIKSYESQLASYV